MLLAGCTPALDPGSADLVASRAASEAAQTSIVDAVLADQSATAPHGVADVCAKDQATSFGQPDLSTWQCWRSDFAVATADDVTTALKDFDARAQAAGCVASGSGGLERVLDEYWLPLQGTSPPNADGIYSAGDLPSGSYDCADGVRLDLQPDEAASVEDFSLMGRVDVYAENGFEVENSPIDPASLRTLPGELIMIVTTSQQYYTYPR
ncbi:hypothetical protein BH11ACT3_BH11ACT3_15240 [soil metagenome]